MGFRFLSDRFEQALCLLMLAGASYRAMLVDTNARKTQRDKVFRPEVIDRPYLHDS
jgi:hypothetical protein